MQLAPAILLLLTATSLIGADPPPALDQALRERVTQFNQLRVDRKFRQAEALVAEDSKDFFYESPKADLRSFNIEKIEYAPDLTSAVVTVRGKVSVVFPGVAQPMIVESTGPMEWKFEKMNWYWFIDKAKLEQTPFGKAAPALTGTAKDAKPDLQALALKTVETTLATGAVQTDREEIELDPQRRATAAFTIKNILPGAVTLEYRDKSRAIDVQIAKPSLGASDSTQVSVTPVEGSNERPLSLTIYAMPFDQPVNVRMNWIVR